MTRAWLRVAAAPALALLFVFQACGQTPGPEQKKAWALAWSDEFNAANGSGMDSSKWVAETGGDGWGNQELEYYTARTQNAYVQDGNLVVKAMRENYQGPDGVKRDFTSARLKTLGKFSQTTGRFEARIKLPQGQGMWPAFWMLGDDIDKVGWPACGEIDIMENIGKEPDIVHGSIHGPGYIGSVGLEASYKLPRGARFSDDFHIFAVEWEADAIRFYVDDQLYSTRTHADLKPGWKWAFDHPFFLLLNVAVGGDWPGNPDPTTSFPQTMLVDYVRVYRRADASAGK
ncbi:MAG TPA: glycoside hydrolase family 16 protein [Candidatus Sulfotelmatobacter sp.]